MRFAFYEACHWLEMYVVAVKPARCLSHQLSVEESKSEFFFGHHQTSAEKFAEFFTF